MLYRHGLFARAGACFGRGAASVHVEGVDLRLGEGLGLEHDPAEGAEAGDDDGEEDARRGGLEGHHGGEAGELDERVLQALASLTEGDGIAALAEFMRADMSKIRNKSAYLSGVVSRIKGESVGKTGASSQFSAAPGNGLSYASAAAPMGV